MFHTLDSFFFSENHGSCILISHNVRIAYKQPMQTKIKSAKRADGQNDHPITRPFYVPLQKTLQIEETVQVMNLPLVSG
jgi:hypothetical protein